MDVADRLRELVLVEHADGEYLGSEDDLVARFGVSRPTLRQAIRMVQTEGLVLVRRGNNGGFFASRPSVQAVTRTASILLRHQGATAGDLVEVSLLIAPEVGALAAGNPDAEARAELLTFAREVWAPSAPVVGPDVVAVAAEFGHRMGRLARNPALALFTAVLSDLVLVAAASIDPDEDAAATEALAGHLGKSHLQVARAVAEGDVAAAADAMRRMVTLAPRDLSIPGADRPRS
jgi:DNA-binding FadR family transcriptional regulator